MEEDNKKYPEGHFVSIVYPGEFSKSSFDRGGFLIE